ncbi:hypothetical protein BHE74_00018994 [Ensete ventricosum]|nr:hypothetical protein BHE74_00018994 [Ensete ventricosum]
MTAAPSPATLQESLAPKLSSSPWPPINGCDLHLFWLDVALTVSQYLNGSIEQVIYELVCKSWMLSWIGLVGWLVGWLAGDGNWATAGARVLSEVGHWITVYEGDNLPAFAVGSTCRLSMVLRS